MANRNVRFLLLGLAALIVVGLGVCSRNTQTDRAASGAEVKVVAIPVEGMTCAACVARVKKGLARLDGVTDVEVSLADRSARVRYIPDKLSPAQVAIAINDLGYQAGEPVDVR